MEQFADLLSMLFGFVLFIGVIALIIFAIKKGQEQQEIFKKEALAAQVAIQKIVDALPENKKTLFMIEYNARKKNSTTAVLLAVFLGNVGAHKFYLGNTSMGVIYLLFFWTYVPGIIGIIEAFTIGRQVQIRNAGIARQMAALLDATSAKSSEKFTV